MSENKKKKQQGNTKKASSGVSTVVRKKRKHLKIVLIIAVIAFAAVAVMYLAIQNYEAEKKAAMTIPVYGDLEFENNNLPTPDYYKPDYTADIFKEAEYLELINGRPGIQYIKGNISFDLNDRDDAELEPGMRFFKKYFYAVNHGDYKSYNGMFAPEYEGNPTIYGENPTKKKFPMQRLYNVSVKELFVSDNNENVYNGKHAVFGVYEVRYSISKNDGEFRYNLESDTVLPVIYQTVTTDAGTDNEKTLITKVYYYSDISDQPKENEAE